ncbi:hypothetical protein BDR22DRAFT_822851 [Usnea florida]
MGRHSTAIDTELAIPQQSPSRKRKRKESIGEELEVDMTAPEPPSKKALRKAKKGKAAPAGSKPESKSAVVQSDHVSNEIASDAPVNASVPPKRSEYGIWIGNLPWTASKADLRSFLTKDTGISDNVITRLHLPAPSQGEISNSRQKIKPQNKGFAYIDFSTQDALREALALSEKLFTGRRLLIKDSKSFEGRPEKLKEEEAAIVNSGKPPSKRIFVGNLAFETTKEDLQEHFASCGQILDVHLATFEDTGKCKGYAWVEFAELEAGEAAVRGWVHVEQKVDGGDKDEEIAEALVEEDEVKLKKKHKPRKWWVNQLHGRPLKLEFAEGRDVRYKKRYGKDGSARKEGVKAAESDLGSTAQPVLKIRTSSDKKVPRRIDARTIKPGAALAAASRSTGGIVESQGQKTIFA